MTDVPVACQLTTPELRERRDTVLADFRAAQLEVREFRNGDLEGYAFRFAADGPQLASLAELIDLERQCCPFLHFRLSLEPSGGPMWLELSGPAGTRTLLSDELGFVEGARIV